MTYHEAATRIIRAHLPELNSGEAAREALEELNRIVEQGGTEAQAIAGIGQALTKGTHNRMAPAMAASEIIRTVCFVDSGSSSQVADRKKRD